VSARVINKLRERGLQELPRATYRYKLRRISEFTHVAPVDLHHVKITVKLNEAVDPASKLQVSGFLARLRFHPRFVGLPQAGEGADRRRHDHICPKMDWPPSAPGQSLQRP